VGNFVKYCQYATECTSPLMEPCGVPSRETPPFYVLKLQIFYETWKLRKLVQ